MTVARLKRLIPHVVSEPKGFIVCGKKERTECLLCTKAAKDENKRQVLFITAGDHKNAAARNVWRKLARSSVKERSKIARESNKKDSKRMQQERTQQQGMFESRKLARRRVKERSKIAKESNKKDSKRMQQESEKNKKASKKVAASYRKLASKKVVA
ncbi:hypothetical protein Tco_0502476 [Tanacetum coccineum]